MTESEYKTSLNNFCKHPFIESISQKKKWTVSSPKKVPLDVCIYKKEQRISGAMYTDERSLVSLDELIELIPNTANCTFYLDCITDCFVILDIEPKCPDEIKQKLLNLPYIYGEISMSGKGYHLVFPLPDCFDKYPSAKKKKVMKEEHGYYEILLCHYCTFTRNQLDIKNNDNETDMKLFDNLFEEMAKTQKTTEAKKVDISTSKPEIPSEDKILTYLCTQIYKKTLSDFSDDHSKYEYGYIVHLYRKLKMIQNLTIIQKDSENHKYTDNENTWLLYTAIQDMLQHRPKHDELREGVPWLLYLSKQVVAKVKT